MKNKFIMTAAIVTAMTMGNTITCKCSRDSAYSF